MLLTLSVFSALIIDFIVGEPRRWHPLVGFGNVAGAIAGGFIIAFVQVVTRVYMGEGWESVIPMLMISLVLIFRPTGIFGAKVRGIWER